jgi:hypothetical protein
LRIHMNLASPRFVVWSRRTAWLVGCLLVLWALAWAALPWLLQSQGQTRLSALLGRQVTIGSVEFSPWSLELTVHDLAVATVDQSAAQLSVDRMYVDAELQSLLRLAPVVDAIRVEGVKAQLTHNGQGQYDIDDVLARLHSAPEAEPSAPPRFSLYNLELVNANLDFHDHSAAGAPRLHTLRNVQLSVPFLSSLNSQRDVLVAPHLAFVLNGSAFDSAAQGTPFAQTRAGEAQMQIRQLDLEPYLTYVPAGLPVRLRSAVLDADLKLDFRQAETAALNISGDVTVERLALDDAAGAPLLAVRKVRAAVASLQPLQHKVVLGRLDIAQPSLQLSRNAQGILNVMPAASSKPAASKGAMKKEAAAADLTRAEGLNGSKSQVVGAVQAASAPVAPETEPAPQSLATGGWTLQLDTLAVTEGAVQWHDTQPEARLALTDLAFTVKGVQWPIQDAVELELQTQLKAGAAKQAQNKDTGKNKEPQKSVANGGAAAVRLQARGTDQLGSAELEITAAPLALAQAYLRPWLRPTVQGKLDAKLGVEWKQGKVLLTAPLLRLQDAALLPLSVPPSAKALSRPTRELSSSAMPRLALLEVTDVQLDPAARSVALGKVLLRGASLGVRRDADGRWMAEEWLPPSSDTDGGSKPPRSTLVRGAEGAAGGWRARSVFRSPNVGASAPGPVRHST